MPTVSIVYFSGSGHNARMAEAIAKGAGSIAGTTVKVLPILGKDIIEGRYHNDALLADLDASDAIIFGSPTYMGSVAGQFKAFADATAGRWFGRTWLDKIAAGFSVSQGASGDKLSTLTYLFILAMQHGMVWIGVKELPSGPDAPNRLSFSSGAAGQESPDLVVNAADLSTGEALGIRVAEAAARWVK